MRRIVISSADREGRSVFSFREIPEGEPLPPGAALDNWGEVGDEKFALYAIPGTAVWGRTFAWTMFLEGLAEGDEDGEVEVL